MKNTNRWIALSLALVMLAGSLSPVMIGRAEASTKGRRNVAIGLGILTGVALAKGKTGLAIAGAVGTGIAYNRYRQGKKKDARRASWYSRSKKKRYCRASYKKRGKGHSKGYHRYCRYR